MNGTSKREKYGDVTREAGGGGEGNGRKEKIKTEEENQGDR